MHKTIKYHPHFKFLRNDFASLHPSIYKGILKKCYAAFLFLIPLSCVFAQTPVKPDTLFFNAKWKPCPKADALFYRIAELQDGNIYLIKDMYIKTNTPQMIGFSKTLEPLILEGKCTYYYPDGTKELEGYHENKIATGIWIYWPKNSTDSIVQDKTPIPRKPFTIKMEPYLYNKEHPFSVALRGKAATFFIIEDIYFLTYTLGTEFRYKKHSLGIDATWFRWRYETDNNDDVGMYSQYELKRYLLVDYKFTFLTFERPQVDFYVNMYDKIGKYTMWYDPYESYDHGIKDWTFLQSTAKGTFNQPGLGLGIRKYAEKTGFGLDASANIGYQMANTNERTYINQTETDFKDHVKKESSVFYIRVNAFFLFKK